MIFIYEPYLHYIYINLILFWLFDFCHITQAPPRLIIFANSTNITNTTNLANVAHTLQHY